MYSIESVSVLDALFFLFINSVKIKINNLMIYKHTNKKGKKED